MRIIINNFKQNSKSYLIKGIIAILIAMIGFIFDKKILTKLIIWIFPFLILAYSIKIYIMAFKLIKTDKKHFIIFLLQALLLTGISLYILINPIGTISLIISGIGALLIFGAISTIIFNKLVPWSTLILGLLLLIIPELIINTFQTILLIIILIYGLVQLSTYCYLKR